MQGRASPPPGGRGRPPLHDAVVQRFPSLQVAILPADGRYAIAVLEQETDKQDVSHEELIRLFSVLSHDLRSPIFAIDGFSDLLLGDYADKLDEEGRDFLRRIRSSVQQMKSVLEGMSQIIKLLSRPTSKRPTPLREIFEEVILKYNHLIDEGGVHVDIPADLPTVPIDPEKMREAISALISNALSFNDRPKGERTISVECSIASSECRICVRDNGMGIDSRYTNQIFDPGLKLDKSRGGGPGYGLYLARRVAEEHGGTIRVTSQPSEGSTFCLNIPT